MPPVQRWPDPMAPAGLLASSLAAVIALPLALFISAAGQGLGTLVVGGGWIGVSVPWDRQAWALVNQPVLNFASLPLASGYWLGSTIAPLAVAVLAIPLGLRLRTLASQLFVVQWAWMAAVIGLTWQPFVDPHLSHLSRWLQFRDLPAELRWISVAVAGFAVIPIVLRLIALARISRHHQSRVRRLALIALHLLPTPLVWATTTIALREVVEFEAYAVISVPIVAAIAVAWIGYPPALTHPISAIRGRALANLIVILAVVWVAFSVAGRPLPDDKAAAVQWGRDGSYNNIRPWMEPRRAPWLEPTHIIPGNP